MKTLEWQNFFADQRARHRKVIFSVAELANVAQTSLHALNTELGRLMRRGIIHRYAQGWYGSTLEAAPEEIVSAIDPGAYITGFYALFRHHLVTQTPMEVTCFTNRRHNRKCERVTPVGKLRFIHVPAALYGKPGYHAIVPAEQALCDFAWLCLRGGIDPQSLVTFQHLNTLNRRRLNKALRSYPENVQTSVCGFVGIAAGANSPQ
jgi:hypothetical protein